MYIHPGVFFVQCFERLSRQRANVLDEMRIVRLSCNHEDLLSILKYF